MLCCFCPDLCSRRHRGAEGMQPNTWGLHSFGISSKQGFVSALVRAMDPHRRDQASRATPYRWAACCRIDESNFYSRPGTVLSGAQGLSPTGSRKQRCRKAKLKTPRRCVYDNEDPGSATLPMAQPSYQQAYLGSYFQPLWRAFALSLPFSAGHRHCLRFYSTFGVSRV